jgi:septum formation protein
VKRIYLASRSPRRRELLHQIGIAFEVLPLRLDLTPNVDIDETPLAREAPAAYVTRIARAKAVAGWGLIVTHSLPHQPVLAADTTVVLDNEIIGKPDNARHARSMLRRLSGKTHQVLTAIAVAYEDRIESTLSASTVEFRSLGNGEISRYVRSGEPLDKAGAYAIQGRAAVFVRAMNGSYSGIVGLPLHETAEVLRNFGITLV